MRATTLLSRLLQVKQARVVGFGIEEGAIVVDIALTTRVPRCSGCQRCASNVHDRYLGRRWRHLDLAGIRIELRCDLRRVRCRRCGVRVEAVPWAAPGSRFTRDFEEQVAYVAQRTDRTTVSELMRIAWVTVGQVIARVVERWDLGDRLDGLARIGVDELSYRRHHQYVTVVVDHLQGRIVWDKEGKNAATLKAFFAELGPERLAKLEAVTIDMSGAYIKAVTEASPQAQIIFDRFHVQRLAHDALDAVRREEAREAPTPVDGKALKGTRWPLLRRAWNLRDLEICKVAALTKTNRRLFRAYLLKESLAAILDRKQVNVARRKLDEWLAWACRSRLAPFRKLVGTIRRYKEGILAYVRSGLSNGRTEALNGKARTITRRAYGLHSASALIALLKLCCSGIELVPVRWRPRGTH
jgi:transposase